MSDIWLSTLRTPDPQSGYDLAIKKLSRMAVKITQPDAEIREKLRPGYGNDAKVLIAISQIVALNFQTIAAANRYWSQELSTDGLYFTANLAVSNADRPRVPTA
jgi:hypothetical protein